MVRCCAALCAVWFSTKVCAVAAVLRYTCLAVSCSALCCAVPRGVALCGAVLRCTVRGRVVLRCTACALRWLRYGAVRCGTVRCAVAVKGAMRLCTVRCGAGCATIRPVVWWCTALSAV
jgi:hypothetical protein